jgi:hypothetical protein
MRKMDRGGNCITMNFMAYVLQLILKKDEVGHVAHTGDGRGVYRVLVGRPKGKT